MKKIFAMIIFMLTSMNVFAQSNVKNNQYEELKEIISLNVATGMWRAYPGYDKDNNLVVCQRIHRYLWKDESCRDMDGNNAWAKIKDAVPKGKTFVGFKSASQGDAHYIEIYWK